MGARPRILVVDDESLVTSALCAFLDLQGDFEAIPCPCPLQALELVRKRAVDLVIADYLMPAMDGLALLARVRELAPRLPRILLTGCSSEPSALQGATAGGLDAYMEKPWDNSELERLVRAVLARYRSERPDAPDAQDGSEGTPARGLLRACV